MNSSANVYRIKRKDIKNRNKIKLTYINVKK